MTLLVTGAGGLLGREIVATAAETGRRVAARDHDALDITDAAAVERTVAAVSDLELVVNAAGYTRVDEAETHRQAAFAVNEAGAAHLAAAAAKASVPIVHISTDYVFDGRQTRPYREDDEPAPRSAYGASKLAGEREVARLHPRHIVLRTSWLFGIHGPSFVRTMLRQGRGGAEVRVVDDQTGRPTGAAGLARAIVQVAGRVIGPGFDAWGTYHLAGSPETTWYGFARAIFEEAAGRGLPTPPNLTAVTSASLDLAAPRPRYSVLDCTRIGRVFGIGPPPWRPELATVVEHLGRRPQPL